MLHVPISRKSLNKLWLLAFILFFVAPFWNLFLEKKNNERKIKIEQEIEEIIGTPSAPVYKKIQTKKLIKGYEQGMRGELLLDWAKKETVKEMLLERKAIEKKVKEYNSIY